MAKFEVEKVESLISRLFLELNLPWPPTRNDILTLIVKVEEMGLKKPMLTLRYIDENILSNIQKSVTNGDRFVGVSRKFLDKIAAAYGKASGKEEEIGSFQDFLDTFKRYPKRELIPAPGEGPDLNGIEGWWYSIVRCNSGQSRLLFSPVEIRKAENEPGYVMRLYGPLRTFEGRVYMQATCLVALLTSGQEKQLYLEFDIGISANATQSLLRGVYAGHTSNGDPSCGREVLMKMPSAISQGDLPNYRLDFMDQKVRDRYPELLLPKIIYFFWEYTNNVFKIPPGSTFTLDDLDDPDPEDISPREDDTPPDEPQSPDTDPIDPPEPD